MRELSLHVLDVVQNSLAAGASFVEISIDEDPEEDRLTITVSDNGRGMDKETRQRALDPFFTTRTTRHVGLGLPLFQAAAERCQGSLKLESEPGKGTVVTAQFQRSHIDRAPLGDMVTTLLTIIMSEAPVDLLYRHKVGERHFEMDTRELRRVLEDVPLTHPAAREWLVGYLMEGESELSEG